MRQETMWVTAAVAVFFLVASFYAFYPRSVEPEVYVRPVVETPIPPAPVLPPVAPQVYEEGVMYKG
jgi:hypothetical protein